MDPNSKVLKNKRELYEVEIQNICEKLKYFPITRPCMSFVVGIVSQFMHNPQVEDSNAIIQILWYAKKAT